MLLSMPSSGRRIALWLGCALWLVPVSVAGADAVVEVDASAPPATSSNEPTIDLDLLLKLPDSYLADGARRGGAGRSEWRGRFFQARERLDQGRQELARLQGKMEGMAGDSGTWAVGAPGLGSADPKNSTLSYKLRQEIRRAREEIEQAERDLLELRIEADLADVPQGWRE